MKSIKVMGIAALLVAMSGSAALAKTTTETRSYNSGTVAPLPKATTRADSVVVTPQGNTAPAPAPAAAPAAAPVQVNSAPAAPTAVTPVESSPRKTVVTNSEPQNYMATIAMSALMGAVAGGLVGGAIYFLGDQQNPEQIGYWAAGGVLVGTGVGLVNVAVRESRADQAVATRFNSDPAPTYRLALFKATF